MSKEAAALLAQFFMFRIKVISLLLLVTTVLSAQTMLGGAGMSSSGKKYDPFDNNVRVWTIDPRYGTADTIVIDTAIRNHQDRRPEMDYSIANAWNGNMGSPLQSKIFFDRYYDQFTHKLRAKSDNMFADAYEAYTILPEDVRFYDSKQPFSQLAYRTAFPTHQEEDYLKALLTVNANKYVSFGGLCNFIYGRGQYRNQSSNMVNGGFWARYTGKPYELNAAAMFNSYKNLENGGISDLNYILGGSGIDAQSLPVNMNGAQSKYHDYCFLLNHRYRIGKYVLDTISDDSVHAYYQPIVVIAHGFRAEETKRHYFENTVPASMNYANNFYSDEMTHDSTAYWTITNTLSATLDESFNKKAKFGLSAFIEYEVRHYGVGYACKVDTATKFTETLHNLCAGAIWSKNQGKYIKYNFNGKVYFFGERIGNFDVNGDVKGIIPFKSKKDSAEIGNMDISAGASFSRTSPYHLYYNYYSNHFCWENNEFINPLTLDVHGRVNVNVAGQEISVGVGFRNLTNYIYLNDAAMPAQVDGNVQVLSVDAMLNLKAWLFHLDTKAVYQLTSNKEALPLPDLALYTNFYFMHQFWKKVLTLQIGVSLAYHTEYYANVYVPALGQFRTQHEQLIGNYPDMNVYATLHVKTIRFFLQYAHLNNGLFGGNNCMSMTGYPINPGTFQMGLSWNFWN